MSARSGGTNHPKPLAPAGAVDPTHDPLQPQLFKKLNRYGLSRPPPLASLGNVLLALTHTGAPGPAARGEQGDGERGRAAARGVEQARARRLAPASKFGAGRKRNARPFSDGYMVARVGVGAA